MDYLEYLTRAILALNAKSSETLIFHQVCIGSFRGEVLFYLERMDAHEDDEYRAILDAATLAELAAKVSTLLKEKGLDVPTLP